MDVVALVVGWAGGVFTSLSAAFLWERAHRPDLHIDVGKVARSDSGSHAFFHLRIQNRGREPGAWLGRRPASATLATLELVDDRGNTMLGPIVARWTSTPEPMVPVSVDGKLALDPAKILSGRTIDLHSHREEDLALVLKFEGETDCYLFTNESYAYPNWSNPAWKLGPGAHTVRIKLQSGGDAHTKDFRLMNDGPGLAAVKLEPAQ